MCVKNVAVWVVVTWRSIVQRCARTNIHMVPLSPCIPDPSSWCVSECVHLFMYENYPEKYF